MASKEVIGLVKDFRTLLVCRICNVSNTHHIDWYRCAHLHPICELCRWEHRCSCGQEILKAHDKLVKSILTNKNMPYQCTNKIRGCQEILPEAKLRDHEDNECIFRPVNCPNCQSRMAFNAIVDHYEINHPWNSEFRFTTIKVKAEVEGLKLKIVGNYVPNASMTYEPFKFELQGKVFIATAKLSNGKFQFWIYLIGTRDEAKHFSFSIQLEGQCTESKMPTQLQYSGPVCSIDDTTCSYARRGLTLGLDMFQWQFMDENNETRFSLKIRNLKAEAQDKDDNEESGVSDNEVDDDDDKEINLAFQPVGDIVKKEPKLQFTVVNDRFVGNEVKKEEGVENNNMASTSRGHFKVNNPWNHGKWKIHEDKRKENDAGEVPDYLQPNGTKSEEPEAKKVKYMVLRPSKL